jgi:hypothetical protein
VRAPHVINRGAVRGEPADSWEPVATRLRHVLGASCGRAILHRPGQVVLRLAERLRCPPIGSSSASGERELSVSSASGVLRGVALLHTRSSALGVRLLPSPPSPVVMRRALRPA